MKPPAVEVKIESCGIPAGRCTAIGVPAIQVLHPRISRTDPIARSESVKPAPMPRPSRMLGSTRFLQANISARPKMMQLTVMSERNVPRLSCSSGAKPWSRKSTIVTNPAMMTM